MAREYRVITHQERKRIEAMYAEGKSIYKISFLLGRPTNSVYLEIRRGYTGKLDKNGRKEYSAALSEEKLAKNIGKRGFATIGQPNREKQPEQAEQLEGQESFFGDEQRK